MNYVIAINLMTITLKTLDQIPVDYWSQVLCLMEKMLIEFTFYANV